MISIISLRLTSLSFLLRKMYLNVQLFGHLSQLMKSEKYYIEQGIKINKEKSSINIKPSISAQHRK